MANSTLVSQALTDRLHEQASTRETRYFAAQDAARLQRAQATQVYNSYTFAPALSLCRQTPTGLCTQAAMTLSDETETLTVVAKIDDCGDTLWYITDMTGLRFPASVYIAAVQARIEANRSSKAVN